MCLVVGVVVRYCFEVLVVVIVFFPIIVIIVVGSCFAIFGCCSLFWLLLLLLFCFCAIIAQRLCGVCVLLVVYFWDVLNHEKVHLMAPAMR